MNKTTYMLDTCICSFIIREHPVEVLPWDAAAVERTTDIKRELNRRGTPIGANDTAIAGHAISSGCILVTNNIREFERVPDLRFEDWVH